MSEQTTRGRWARPILAVAGLTGAVGIASAAAASHGEEARLLGAASQICLAHAPLLAALALHGLRSRMLRASALLIVLGTLLFVGDLLARHFLGQALFPLAAPAGGLTMLAGWVFLAFGAFSPLN